MRNKLNKIWKEARSVALTQSEKAAVRSALMVSLVVPEKPSGALGAVRKDVWFRHRVREVLGKYLYVRGLRGKLVIAALIAVLVLTLGGGVSYAAEKSLPGDTLYPIKIHVNEEVRAAVAASPQARAAWEIERALRRVNEAEQLAITGRLSQEVSRVLEARMQTHTTAALEESNVVKAHGETAAAADLQATLRARLQAHGQVLERILEERQEASEAVGLFKASIQAAITEAHDVYMETKPEIEKEKGKTIEAETREKLRKTKEKIKAVKIQLKMKDDTIRGAAATTTVEIPLEIDATVNTEVNVAEGFVESGKANMDDEEYGKAFVELQEAEGLIEGIKTRLQAEKTLNLLPVSFGVAATSTIHVRDQEDTAPPTATSSSEGTGGVSSDGQGSESYEESSEERGGETNENRAEDKSEKNKTTSPLAEDELEAERMKETENGTDSHTVPLLEQDINTSTIDVSVNAGIKVGL